MSPPVFLSFLSLSLSFSALNDLIIGGGFSLFFLFSGLWDWDFEGCGVSWTMVSHSWCSSFNLLVSNPLSFSLSLSSSILAFTSPTVLALSSLLVSNDCEISSSGRYQSLSSSRRLQVSLFGCEEGLLPFVVLEDLGVSHSSNLSFLDMVSMVSSFF